MKKVFMPLMGLMVMLAVSCNNAETTDSAEIAEDKNEQMADSTNAGAMEDDHEFLVEAASSGLMEVQLGEYAAANAASATVKDYAQKMVTDHGKANDELKTLAAGKNIAIPSTPASKHQQHIDDMKAKKGAEFDKAYMDMMVADHQEAIDDFEEASREAKDADIKAFATKNLPILRGHLDLAKSLNNSVKK